MLSLDHLPAREKHRVSPTRTVTIHDGIIFLPPPFPKYSQCTFSPSNIQSKCTAQEDNSLFWEGMERKWGHRVAATVPNTDFLEIYLLGPGLHLLSSVDYEPCTPENLVPPSVVLGPAALILPGSLAKGQNLRPYPSTTDSESVCEHDSQVIHACTKV